MRFLFSFTNDCSEPADHCLRCGHMTEERAGLRAPGLRLTVYLCRTCLAEISFFNWWLHEAPLRASMLAREKTEAGEPEFHYQNEFGWPGDNGMLKKAKA